MKLTYAVVCERTANNYSAYLPDLPGCVAAGATWDDVRENLREAVAFHIEGLQEDGEPIPEPRLSARQALERHAGALAEAGIAAPQPEAQASLVEVEVGSPGAALASAALRA